MTNNKIKEDYVIKVQCLQIYRKEEEKDGVLLDYLVATTTVQVNYKYLRSSTSKFVTPFTIPNFKNKLYLEVYTTHIITT